MSALEKVATGPWDSEPDKLDFQWYKLPCRLRRGPAGHWCGYVGVPKNHPWHGKGYSTYVDVPKSVVNRPLHEDEYSPINLLCARPELVEKGMLEICIAVDVHGGLTWAADHAADTDPDGHWYFGFDCAHCDDLCPKHGDITGSGIYRDIEYTKAQARKLARQLARAGEWEASA